MLHRDLPRQDRQVAQADADLVQIDPRNAALLREGLQGGDLRERAALDQPGGERELILELALPGIDRNDVRVEIRGDALHVSGMRSPERPAEREGRIYHHAEIPRGVFHRLVPLPYAVGEPRIEAELGLIRIRLPRRIKTAPAQA